MLEEGLLTILTLVGAVEVDIVAIEVVTIVPDLIGNLGHVGCDIIVVGVCVKDEDLVVVGEDAVAQVFLIDGIAVLVSGGQSNMEVRETALITTVIPLKGFGVSRNSGLDDDLSALGVVLQSAGPSHVVAVHAVQTSGIVALEVFGVDATLAVEQVDLVAFNHELDLGGSLIQQVAQVHAVFALINVG